MVAWQGGIFNSCQKLQQVSRVQPIAVHLGQLPVYLLAVVAVVELVFHDAHVEEKVQKLLLVPAVLLQHVQLANDRLVSADDLRETKELLAGSHLSFGLGDVQLF